MKAAESNHRDNPQDLNALREKVLKIERMVKIFDDTTNTFKLAFTNLNIKVSDFELNVTRLNNTPELQSLQTKDLESQIQASKNSIPTLSVFSSFNRIIPEFFGHQLNGKEKFGIVVGFLMFTETYINSFILSKCESKAAALLPAAVFIIYVTVVLCNKSFWKYPWHIFFFIVDSACLAFLTVTACAFNLREWYLDFAPVSVTEQCSNPDIPSWFLTLRLFHETCGRGQVPNVLNIILAKWVTQVAVITVMVVLLLIRIFNGYTNSTWYNYKIGGNKKKEEDGGERVNQISNDGNHNDIANTNEAHENEASYIAHGENSQALGSEYIAEIDESTDQQNFGNHNLETVLERESHKNQYSLSNDNECNEEFDLGSLAFQQYLAINDPFYIYHGYLSDTALVAARKKHYRETDHSFTEV